MNARTVAAFGVGLVVVLAAVWVWRRGVAGVAEDTARGAVGVVGGVATGTVKGVGSFVGIPDTDMQKCRDALARGDHWNASFFCPASAFIGSVFGGSAPGVETKHSAPPLAAVDDDEWPVSSHLSDF